MSKKKLFIIIPVMVVVLLIITTCLLLVFYDGPKEVPKELQWYEDYENMELVLEEERLEGKRVSLPYRYDFSKKIELTVVINKDNMDDKEYMPKVKLLYKGEEKEVFFRLEKAYIPFNGTELEYDKAIPIHRITNLGYHSVIIYAYLTQEDREHLNRELHYEHIYIDVIWEGESIS